MERKDKHWLSPHPSDKRTEFELFCGSEIWDDSLSWNTINGTAPDFTICFQEVVACWIPCGFFWICLPFYLYYFSKEKRCYIQKLSVFSVTKSAICLVLAVISLFSLGYDVAVRLYNQNVRDPLYISEASYISAVLEIISMVAAAVLVQKVRLKGFFSSGVLWCYWLLWSLGSFIPFYSEIVHFADIGEIDDASAFTIKAIYFGLCLLQFILASISDADDETKKNFENICPEYICSFPSFLTFSWFTSIVTLGYQKDLTRADLWNLSPKNKSKEYIPAFEADWNMAVKKWKRQKEEMARNCENNSIRLKGSGESDPLIEHHSPAKDPPLSFVRIILKHHGWSIFIALSCKFAYDWIQFLCPLLQGMLMELVMSRSNEHVPGTPVAPAWQGYILTIFLVITQVIMTILFQHMWYLCLQVGFRIRAAVIAILYKKALRLGSDSKEKTTTSEVVNLMAVDGQRMQDVFMDLWTMPSSIVQVVLCLWQLYVCVGPSVFLGFGLMVVILPVTSPITVRQKAIQAKQMKLKDTRVKLTNEMLSGIKVIKLYAWEPSFEEKISAIRAEEIKNITAYWNSLIVQFFIITALLYTVTTVIYTMYVIIEPDHILTPTAAYVTLTLFNILGTALLNIPLALSSTVMASVSVNRIVQFFKNSDLSEGNIEKDQNCDADIRIVDGTFSWSPDSAKILRKVNFEVPPKSLTAVVGQVGSGKSSLLSACVGDMYKHCGKVIAKDSVAFVAQQAWIQNGTVRDNILFGKAFDQEKYDKIVKAVALKPDLKILHHGDQTYIGEKGINLSGGQKQRVSLARACYSESDLYLFDDPLSAVDAHVGREIFEQVIGPKGLLKNKTRVLVTHGLQWLPEVDSISVLAYGKVTESGSYDSLLEKKGAFAQLIESHVLSEDVDSDLESEYDQSLNSYDLFRLNEGLSIQELSASFVISNYLMSMNQSHMSKHEEPTPLHLETLESGKLTVDVYKYYVKAIGRYWTILSLVSGLVFALATVAANIWLSTWTNDERFLPATCGNYTKQEQREATNFYLAIYWVFTIAQLLTILLMTASLAYGSISASKYVHSAILHTVMRLQMTFFDTRPLGQILNRFSKDVDVIDNIQGLMGLRAMTAAARIIASLITVMYGTPIFLIVLGPLLLCYYAIQRYFIRALMQLKRWEAVTRSPIFTHFGETIVGAQTIRAFGAQKRFIQNSEQFVEENNLFFYSQWTANRWLAVRLQVLSGILVGLVAGLCVFSTQVPFLKDYINSSFTGMAITYSLYATLQYTQFSQSITDFETNAVSIERIKEYSELPLEADWTTDKVLPEEWPVSGAIQFRHYSTKYRPELNPVLKDLSISIKPQEKIGIVGRTGAGKSSMAVALFRLIEASKGSVSIDGVNIGDIGLHQLRNKLTILPQDPTVFAGNIRDNLDPFNEYSDDKIWEVLEQSYLKEYVEEQPEKLEYECGESGTNLSVGQRQLVCLARALLRKTKILVLDEATAAVDLETDHLIQKTIKTAFADCTILTIAHRLNTIMDSDKILVMDKGMVAEFDTPENLLKDEEGIFSGMVMEAGLKTK
ncbi:multidrug resistance-associated protein 1-like isoform X2 [Watersipora subatra]|uniref:multidrug resistance-associated protein 1-like isoform X2 n=1 Tax=Watersipora subatra TaxID=2589382 RepID=UPI00355B45D2